MREPISLKEILAVVLKKGTMILCFALIFAILAGGYQFKKQLDLANDPANSETTLEQTYQEKLTLYEEQLANLNSSLENTQSKLERQSAYNSSSVLMNLDPYNTAVNTTIIAITGVDEILLQEQYTQKELTPTYFTSIIQDLYRMYWESLVLEEELSGHSYEDIPEQYLRELISSKETDSSTFTLTVYGETKEDADKLGDAVYKRFVQMKSLVESNTYPHDLSIINRTTKIEIVDDIESRQESGKTLVQGYMDEIKSLQEQIKDLEPPKKGTSYGTRAIIVSTAKWAVLGAVVGVVLACVWILVLFLMRSRVESSRQMEQVLGIPFLGSAAKRGGLWKQLANKLLGERTWAEAPQASAFIAENLKAELNSGAQIAVVTTLAAKDTAVAVKPVLDAASTVCGKVSCVQNAEKNPETIALFTDCKYAILAERIGVSEVPEMMALLDMAKRMDVTVIGFVTV